MTQLESVFFLVQQHRVLSFFLCSYFLLSSTKTMTKYVSIILIMLPMVQQFSNTIVRHHHTSTQIYQLLALWFVTGANSQQKSCHTYLEPRHGPVKICMEIKASVALLLKVCSSISNTPSLVAMCGSYFAQNTPCHSQGVQHNQLK